MRCDAERLGAALSFALACASPSALAHHSSAPFDEKAEITLEGTVTKFEWANPHVYIFLDGVETASQRRASWEIEGPPPSILKQRGWSRESLASGDRIKVDAHPARDPSRAAALLSSVTKADGTKLSRSGEDVPAPTFKADGLTGTWVTQINEETGALFDDDSLQAPGIWPLTAGALQAARDFHEDTDLSGLRCIPYTAPMFMLVPDAKSIERRGATITIRGEFDGAERTVHLDVASHDGAEPSLQGHSIGHWDGRVLVVDTAGFVEHRNGTTWSVPSSTHKHLVERFELAADGKSLSYRFELDDPEYLARPLAAEARWSYRPDVTYHAEPCDPANARRFVAH